jgi:hypothetical protein
MMVLVMVVVVVVELLWRSRDVHVRSSSALAFVRSVPLGLTRPIE